MNCVHLHRLSKSNIASDLHNNMLSCVIITVSDRVSWQEDVRSLLPQIVEIATVTLFGCQENKGLRKSAICLLAACARLNRTYREICLQVISLLPFLCPWFRLLLRCTLFATIYLYLCLSLPPFLSIYLSLYLSYYHSLSFFLSLSLSLSLSVFLFFLSLSTFVFFYLSLSLSI